MPDSITAHSSKSHLRQHFRQKRKQLNRYQQQTASVSLCKKLTNQPLFHKSQHIALYLPNDGEIDPTPIIDLCQHTQKQFYLPVILRSKQLIFAPYLGDDTQMQKNRFGILEPSQTQGIKQGHQLDLVLMPLVAFDEEGNRLGMGGGFYDRTFAFKAETKSHVKPALIGIAHHIQQAQSLQTESWDISLDKIITDQAVIKVKEVN